MEEAPIDGRPTVATKPPPRLLRDNVDPSIRKYKQLKVSGPDLADPPDILFELKKLKFLDLSPERETCLHFKLMKVPRRIASLENLTFLCLGTNELTEIPVELCGLVKLERLILSNNLLITLPKEFRQLQRLQSLHLANNYFEEIPRTVFFLKNLEFLDASDNKISRIPRDVGNLVKLHTLLLYFNLLSTLPEELGNCLNLHTVWLGMNSLLSLPRCFGGLKHLDWADQPLSSNLDGNPLETPPIEVCLQGPDAIADFFETNPRAVAYTTGFTAEEDKKDCERAHSDDEAPTAFTAMSPADLNSSGSWSVESSQSFPGAGRRAADRGFGGPIAVIHHRKGKRK
ncbi:leucine-rich repeat-containing protein 1-like [Asterias rubens]|uniref:leucine-rich repeat-containing protein 1-like n=1 Tax=Asterias rubens TaxID=7604 RepID=UPI0014559FA7|nr:leucine-rich repeat-containing protein 1-like [Asterias rubens]